MKKLLVIALNVIVWSLIGYNYAHSAETEKVCIDKISKDGKTVMGKDGKPQQDCKVIKIHKKLEGTAVPPKK
jgi:ammonia channel protein AmtB